MDGMTTHTTVISRSRADTFMQTAGTLLRVVRLVCALIVVALLILLTATSLAAAQQPASSPSTVAAAEKACVPEPNVGPHSKVVMQDNACSEPLTAEPGAELIMAQVEMPDVVEVETPEAPDEQESVAVVGWGTQTAPARITAPPELANILQRLDPRWVRIAIPKMTRPQQ